MKKIYTLIIIVSMNIGWASGQDTIRFSDFAAIGDTIRLVDDFTVSGLSVGSGGVNQTWNFSGLGVDDLDTLIVRDPALTPYASAMPTATIAIQLNDGYTYMDVNNNKADIVGLGGDILNLGVPVEVPFKNHGTQIKFPTMYQHQTQDTSSFTITGDPTSFGLTNLPLTIDSIKVISNTYSLDSVDGWGQLITVTDTFNCIRRWREDYRIDSIFIIAPSFGTGWQLVPAALMSGFPAPYNQTNPTIIDDYKFEWLAKGADYIAMAIHTDDQGLNPTRATYIVGEKLLAQITASQDITCNGGMDGSASVGPIFGTPTYTYLWDDVNAQTTLIATGLPAGTYNVTITDGIGDEAYANITLIEPTVISVVTTLTADASCSSCNDGGYTVSAGGGGGSYSYSWSTSSTATVINNAAPGTYTVTVVDINGCSATSTVTVGSWPVSVPEIKVGKSLVYPNPSYGHIVLEVDAASNSTIELLNILGEVILTKKVSLSQGSNNLHLNVSQGGVYFMNIIDEDNVIRSHKITILK